jgi:hypothetical protein
MAAPCCTSVRLPVASTMPREASHASVMMNSSTNSSSERSRFSAASHAEIVWLAEVVQTGRSVRRAFELTLCGALALLALDGAGHLELPPVAIDTMSDSIPASVMSLMVQYVSVIARSSRAGRPLPAEGRRRGSARRLSRPATGRRQRAGRAPRPRRDRPARRRGRRGSPSSAG